MRAADARELTNRVSSVRQPDVTDGPNRCGKLAAAGCVRYIVRVVDWWTDGGQGAAHAFFAPHKA